MLELDIVSSQHNSYIPLYRKYRPQRFSDLVGQDSLVKTLSNAINLNKVAHAYLFTGSRGTGKTSSARILAKSLNCVDGPTTTPCGKCPSCIDIANSCSVDVVEIDAASNRKVEDARNLLEKVHFMPLAGKYKVYIIDEVHMLTTEAFNTLLKTLEEPPAKLVFILATTETQKVLPTIISRCQRFDFKRVPHDLIGKRLREISDTEKININDKALSVIAKRCNGGMRDALGLLDQISVLSSVQNGITEEDIYTLSGSMPEDSLYAIAECIADRNTETLIAAIQETTNTNEPVQVARELMNYFRNMLLVGNTGDFSQIKNIVNLSENILPQLKKQADKFEPTEIVQIIEKLSETERNIRNSAQQFLWLEVGLIGICNRHEIRVIKDMQERIMRLEQAISPGNTSALKPVNLSSPPAPPQTISEKLSEKPFIADSKLNPEQVLPIEPSSLSPALPSSTENISVPSTDTPSCASSSDTHSNWSRLLENIASQPAKAFLGLSTPIEVNSEKITLTFKTEINVKQAKDKSKLEPLEKASEKMFGQIPKIIIRTSMPEDNLAEKKNKSSQHPLETPRVQQISTPIMENIPENISAVRKQPSPVVVDEKPDSELEKEVVQELEELEREVMPVNISEQAKMVLTLFNGKIID